MIKGRINKQVPRLVDVYNSVTFTETESLSRNNVVSPELPDTLVDCLLRFISPDVLNVMTRHGIESFLEMLIDEAIDVLTNDDVMEKTNEVERLIFDGCVVECFGWMPDGWVISEQEVPSSHAVVHSDNSNVSLHDGVPFLEPFIDLATRSVPIFQMLQSTLTSLYDLAEGEPNDDAPISFRFLAKEFERFVMQAEENDEMKHVLNDLFDSLKRLAENQERSCVCERRKQSIVDPGFVRVCGPMTTSTSARVDGTALPQKTKIVEHLKPRGCVERERSVTIKRRNVCCVCLGRGHQARTCPEILLDANSARATKFFRLLISQGKDED